MGCWLAPGTAHDSRRPRNIAGMPPALVWHGSQIWSPMLRCWDHNSRNGITPYLRYMLAVHTPYRMSQRQRQTLRWKCKRSAASSGLTTSQMPWEAMIRCSSPACKRSSTTCAVLPAAAPVKGSQVPTCLLYTSEQHSWLAAHKSFMHTRTSNVDAAYASADH